MEESILVSVKKILGMIEGYDAFDTDLIMHINTVLGILIQMGIGTDSFYITGPDETWSDFLGTKNINLPAVRTWVALKTRMIFDPPTTNVLAEAINANLKELEWRIYVTENYIGEI